MIDPENRENYIKGRKTICFLGLRETFIVDSRKEN